MRTVFLLILVCLAGLVFVSACAKEEGPAGGYRSLGEGPCICIQVYDPVCGSDGKTYSNSCFAECAGVSWTKGVCQ